EAIGAVTVDAAVADVESSAGDRRSLAPRNHHGLRILDWREAGADIGDEVRNLRLRDDLAPNRHVGLLGVRRLAKAVVDDVPQLAGGQTLTHRRQRRHRRIRAPAATAGDTFGYDTAVALGPTAGAVTVLVRSP